MHHPRFHPVNLAVPGVLRVRGLTEINARRVNDSEYLEIEGRIDLSESDAIHDRWQFGRMMLTERGDRGRLPNGRMEALVRLTGKSKSELSYRAQFAEMCPTEQQLSNALDSCKSWHASVESLSGKEKPYASRCQGDTDVWLTPPGLVRRLGPFDLDPCAAPSPRPWPTAKRHIELPEDGLKADWTGARVFLNPPFGRETPKWLQKMSEHQNGILLVFDCAASAYWHEFVWPKASAVLFLRGHIRFHRNDGRQSRTGSAFPSSLVAFGAKNVEALRNSGLAGSFVRLPAEMFSGVRAGSL